MAVTLKKLQGDEIADEHKHLGDEIFQVVTADSQEHFFSSETDAAAKVAELIAGERDADSSTT